MKIIFLFFFQLLVSHFALADCSKRVSEIIQKDLGLRVNLNELITLNKLNQFRNYILTSLKEKTKTIKNEKLALKKEEEYHEVKNCINDIIKNVEKKMQQQKKIIKAIQKDCDEFSENINKKLITQSEANTEWMKEYFSEQEYNLRNKVEKINFTLFRRGTCQESSIRLAALMLKKYHSYKDKDGGFILKIGSDEHNKEEVVECKMDYCMENGVHAFLKLNTHDNNKISIVLDPTYFQFIGKLNPKGHEDNQPYYIPEDEHNKEVLKKPNIFVGTVQEITELMKDLVPKTGRKLEDQAPTIAMWKNAPSIDKNSEIEKELKNAFNMSIDCKGKGK